MQEGGSNKDANGVCVWLTGRSGAGKSTITNSLVPLLEEVDRTISVLDVVPELGKLPGERTSEGKLMRKAFVAREVVRHGGVAICVTVSARAEVREAVRVSVGKDRFVEVHVEAPSSMAENRRNRRSGKRSPSKRLRRLARRIRSLAKPTPPKSSRWPGSADLTLDAINRTPQENARVVFDYLVDHGFVDATTETIP